MRRSNYIRVVKSGEHVKDKGYLITGYSNIPIRVGEEIFFDRDESYKARLRGLFFLLLEYAQANIDSFPPDIRGIMKSIQETRLKHLGTDIFRKCMFAICGLEDKDGKAFTISNECSFEDMSNYFDVVLETLIDLGVDMSDFWDLRAEKKGLVTHRMKQKQNDRRKDYGKRDREIH